MNNARRKTIAAIVTDLTTRCDDLEGLLVPMVADVLDEEQEYLDAMPEAIQTGTKGDATQEVIDRIQEAHDRLEEAIEALRDVVTALEEAAA